ncbi:hypothetical protein D8S78_16790 [Natrialba swarupiae]|nr:hypothetical protein [Natrialba swarupiae]
MLATVAVLTVGARSTAASSGSAETNGVRPYGHGPYGTSVYPAAVLDISDEPSLSLEHVVWTTETSDTPFDVTATIGNDAETTAEGDVTVAVVDDDDVMVFRETKSLEIDANASETVTFEDILDGLPEGEYVFSISVADDPGEFEATVKVTDRGYDTDEDGWGVTSRGTVSATTARSTVTGSRRRLRTGRAANSAPTTFVESFTPGKPAKQSDCCHWSQAAASARLRTEPSRGHLEVGRIGFRYPIVTTARS